MSTLDEMKRRMKHKFGHKNNESLASKHLPEAVDQTVQHHYERRQQPVIVRENHNVEIKQVIQPIEYEEEVENEHQEFVRAYAYNEQLHDMTPHHREIRDQNRRSMNLTRHETLPDTHETLPLEPIVEERYFNHVVEEIQPVLKQRKFHRHVLTEYVPIFEKHMHVSNIAELTTASPIKKSEWSPSVSQRILHWEPAIEHDTSDRLSESDEGALNE